MCIYVYIYIYVYRCPRASSWPRPKACLPGDEGTCPPADINREFVLLLLVVLVVLVVSVMSVSMIIIIMIIIIGIIIIIIIIIIIMATAIVRTGQGRRG